MHSLCDMAGHAASDSHRGSSFVEAACAIVLRRCLVFGNELLNNICNLSKRNGPPQNDRPLLLLYQRVVEFCGSAEPNDWNSEYLLQPARSDSAPAIQV